MVKDDGGITAEPGDTVVYSLTIENVGTRNAAGVLVTETVPADTIFAAGSSDPAWICSGTTPGSSCSLSLGSVAAGARPLTRDFAVVINSPVDAGVDQISNAASIDDDGTGGADLDPSNNTASDSTPITEATAPDLIVLKSDGGITAAAGDVIAYDLTVSNVGTQDASGVRISETVPLHTTFAGESSHPAWICSGTMPGSTCILSVGPIAAGFTPLSYTFAVQVDSPVPTGLKSISNTASIDDDGANGTDLDPSNNTASDSTPITEATAPDLILLKSDGNVTATAGDVITYDLTVSNVGTQDATGVRINESVPLHTIFAGGSSHPAWICSGTTPGSTCILSVGRLTAGSVAQSYSFAVEVGSPVPADVKLISNTARVEDDGTGGTDLNPADNTSTDATPLAGATGPDLVVHKSDGDISVATGDVFAYTLTVSNIGSQNASGVVLTETVPAFTTLATDSSHPPWICSGTTAGSTCILNIGMLNADEPPQSYSFAIEVDSSVPAGANLISNTATVNDDGTSGADLDQSNNSASDHTPILPQDNDSPDLLASKIDRVVEPDVSDVSNLLTIEYLVLLHNQGDADALDIIYTPEPDSHTVYITDSASTSQGEIVPLNEPPFFEVRINTIAPGEELAITYAVTLNLAEANDLDYVECQGIVRGLNFQELVTDDPDTSEPDDPTRTDLSEHIVPVDIPVLSFVGILMLSAVLVRMACRRISDRRLASSQ